MKKKLLIIIFFIVIISSCWKNENNLDEKKNQQIKNISNESFDIIDNWVIINNEKVEKLWIWWKWNTGKKEVLGGFNN